MTLEADATVKLRESIESARLAMEPSGGRDLEAIVAETAYDYWPQRAMWTRAREHVAASVSAGHDLPAIEPGEREALAVGIGRTQEALRGEGIDLGEIVREGSRQYWAERRRLEGRPAPNLDASALAAMARMLRDGQKALASRRERRRPWRDVLYDAVAVIAPLLVVPPLLLSVVQGSVALPTAARLKSVQAFADREFMFYSLGFLVVGVGVLLAAYRQPEKRRRVLQFGGALGASLVMAVIGAAYIYGNRMTSRLDRMQGVLVNGMLVSLERSEALGYVIIPSQTDRSMTFETRSLTSSLAWLSAQTPGLDGEIRVRLRPASADYFWLLNGREIPKGGLVVGHIAACDPEGRSITLRTGDHLRTYPTRLSGVKLPIGSRVAANIGPDDTVTGLVGLAPHAVAFGTLEKRPQPAPQ